MAWSLKGYRELHRTDRGQEMMHNDVVGASLQFGDQGSVATSLVVFS